MSTQMLVLVSAGIYLLKWMAIGAAVAIVAFSLLGWL